MNQLPEFRVVVASRYGTSTLVVRAENALEARKWAESNGHIVTMAYQVISRRVFGVAANTR